MGHNNRLLLVVIPSLVCMAIFSSKTAAAQQGIQADAARDGTDRSDPARVWDASTSGSVLTLKGHSNGVVSVAFCQGSERVVSGGADCTARVWDARTGTQLLKIDKTGFNRCYASVCSDGSRILTTNIPYVKLWDAKTGNEVLDLTRPVGLESCWPFPFHAVISSDGKQIITGSPALRVAGTNVFPMKLRDTKTGTELVTLKGQDYWPNCAAFSPDGSRLVTGCQTIDDAARVWDTKSGAELYVFKGHGGSTWSMCFSPDGQRVATGGANGRVRVWDMKTGTEVLTFAAHERVVTAISFNLDGSRILTGSQDRTARVWNAKSGAELITLLGHTEIVNSAAFSPDGNYIVTASGDKTARIWDCRKFLNTSLPEVDGTTPPQPK